MKTFCRIALAGLIILNLAGTLPLQGKRLNLEEKETIQKTLTFPDPKKKPGEILVDNLFGSVIVEGHRSPEVKLVAYKTIKARSKEKIQKAKNEVTLDITAEGSFIDLYVNGPFRCPNDRHRWSQQRDPGYEVHYDFEIKVPHKIDLYLKTVTGGDILVNDVEGRFEVRNVNGKITMTGIAGGGDAHTVNGSVRVDFVRNPEKDCSFKTVNGRIEIGFVDGFSADLRLKTFNGDALSDFPVTYLPTRPAVQDRKQGKFVYKSDRFVGVRIGKGGPEIEMDTLNGDILINKIK